VHATGGVKFYSPVEEAINIGSHALGLVLSVFALIALILKASATDNAWNILIVGIFGVSLILLYATSTLYHSATRSQRRKKLRIVDHAMIYVLIAGSYTPLTLITLDGKVGWLIFGASWGMALTGITLKIFFTGRYELLSTLMYVFMGWLVVFAIKPLIRSLPLDGLYWLLAGGLFYTVGAILYAIKGIRFNHAIFHLFVLAGSASHFVTVFVYVLPAAQLSTWPE
jgi:hemolysin III